MKTLSCSLEGRISYLSRAIMCVKSSEGAGELLHHLEEKMEVSAVLQLSFFEVFKTCNARWRGCS